MAASRAAWSSTVWVAIASSREVIPAVRSRSIASWADEALDRHRRSGERGRGGGPLAGGADRGGADDQASDDDAGDDRSPEQQAEVDLHRAGSSMAGAGTTVERTGLAAPGRLVANVGRAFLETQ